MDNQERERRRRAALEWVEARWTESKRCPICGHTDWSVATVYEMREFEAGDLVVGVGNQIVPAFPVSCTTCGYIRWFNAVHAGVIPSQTPAEGGASSESESQAEDSSGSQ